MNTLRSNRTERSEGKASRRLVKRRGIDLMLAVFLLGAAFTAPQACGEGAAASAVRVRTVATTSNLIVAFAQDGARLATLERPRKTCDKTAFVVRSPRGRRLASVPVAVCDAPTRFAFGGNRATWRTEYYGNNGYYNLTTVTTRMRRPIAAGEELVLDASGDGSSYSDLAADGGVSVFGVMTWGHDEGPNGGSVWRIGEKNTAVTDAPAPGALAVSGTRIAVAPPPLAGCACTSGPAWSPDGAEIAYATRGEDHDWEIVTLKPGASPARVTTDNTYNLSPDWSPDGTRLVYSVGNRLVTSRRDGTDARTIAEGYDPAWSPSSASIAFAKDDGIWLVNVDGSGERRVVDGGGWSPTWSPDGNQLAFSRWTFDSLPEVFVTDLAGGAPRKLAVGLDPDWSPDGQRIAYAAYDTVEFDFDLHSVRPDGTDNRTLSSNAALEFEPAWSPDGTRIAFVRAQRDPDDGDWVSSEVYSIPSGGGAEARLTVTRKRTYRKPVEIRSVTGALVSRFMPTTQPADVALSAEVAATISASKHPVLELFDATTGKRLGRASVPRSSISVSGRTVVLAAGRRIWTLDARKRKRRLVAIAAREPLGLSIEGRRIAWAENFKTSARIRAVVLP